MPALSSSVDYKAGQAISKTASGDAAVGDFLHLLARAVHKFRTYPESSPLCTEAIAACSKAFAAVDVPERLVFSVTPHELTVDEQGFGAGTVVEHELARRLHRAAVAAIEIERTVSVRDLTRFCADVARCERFVNTKTSLLELLTEGGVETVVAKLAHRPEVLEIGAPPAAVCSLVVRERERRAAATSSGPVSYLYPPQKGWVRLDPSAKFDSVSLIDLAVLVDDPAEVATMLLRLTDDDPIGPDARETALQQKFSDVSMLFAALDPHLARIMFGKLASAVLALEPDRRSDLLRRTILPGLLDGRVDGSVLHDFPDLDLAESLCLLLDLETAAPEVLTTALDRLGLAPDRRAAVAPLLDARLRARAGAADNVNSQASRQGIDRYVRRLVQIDAPGKSFAEFAAFDLSIDDHTAATIAGIAGVISTTDIVDVQLQCARSLVRLEPNPTDAAAFLRRALELFGELERAGRWSDVAVWASRFRTLAEGLAADRPDVSAEIGKTLAAFWSTARLSALAALHERDDEGRALASALVDAFGKAIAGPFVHALQHQSAHLKGLIALMCAHARLFAADLAAGFGRYNAAATRAAVRVLGYAGGGHEPIIAEQLGRGDEQTDREALRALARIGTARAASIVMLQFDDPSARARTAAEEALWHFPPAQIRVHVRDLLRRREFVLHHPDLATRLLDRAADHVTPHELGDVLEALAPLRFRFWNPAVVRVALKARGLRDR